MAGTSRIHLTTFRKITATPPGPVRRQLVMGYVTSEMCFLLAQLDELPTDVESLARVAQALVWMAKVIEDAIATERAPQVDPPEG
jgi:hypothetical protein